MKKRFVLILTLILFPIVARAETVKELLVTCSQAHSHVEETECLENRLTQSEKNLGEAEKDVFEHINRQGRETQDAARADKNFVEATKAFGLYAKEQCDFYASTAFGGNGGHDLRLACLTNLNDNRAAELGLIASSSGE